MNPFFSIITVTLNPGAALAATVSSVLEQDFENWELIIKDAGSTDGSLKLLPVDSRIRIISKKDGGIYDAMNQGLEESSGTVVNFLNAGDQFYDQAVLSSICDKYAAKSANFIYGYMFNQSLSSEVRYPETLSNFFLFRNTICHQAQFITRELLIELNGYDTDYRLRADYDLYLRAQKMTNFESLRIPILVVAYDGSGVSASSDSADILTQERKIILKKHFSWFQRVLYQSLHELTLVRLRRFLEESKYQHMFRFILNRINHFGAK